MFTTFKFSILTSIILFNSLLGLSQNLTISTAESYKKIVALIDLHDKGQLLISQKDNYNTLYILLIDNKLEQKWEATYEFEDGNGKKSANTFTFLHNSTTIFIINQNKRNLIGQIDIETGDILFEQTITGTSDLRKGDYYISNELLIQANTEGNLLRIQKIRDYSLIDMGEIFPRSGDEAVKKTSLQVIKISHDTVFAYHSLPDVNHRKLNLIFYRYKTNGQFIDSACNSLRLSKHAFAFNSTMDLNCQYIFDFKNKLYMFGNLAPRLSDKFGQFPASDESRGIWWASFDNTMHTSYFNVYPFTSIFQKNEEIIFGQEKYWGVKADGDSGFYLNMNLIPGGIYTGNLTYYINTKGELKRFTNAEAKENFMRYNPIFTRQYIKYSDVLVTNDEWNFYATHHFNKIIYMPQYHSKYSEIISKKANLYPDDAQKSELSYTILYKDGFAIIAEYYYKKKKEVKFEIVR